MGRDTQREDFTVVGVGDMSGDVFGNGMLLSPHIKLLAAFDHRHIFVDPIGSGRCSGRAAALFYRVRRGTATIVRSCRPDRSLQSRSEDAHAHAADPRKLGLDAERLTPINSYTSFCAPRSTFCGSAASAYVKSADGRTPKPATAPIDALRVNGRELRCKVVGEGANLGVTQLGRIEYARAGGRINTDFVDNSGGVDCSDHEVNIKFCWTGSSATET